MIQLAAVGDPVALDLGKSEIVGDRGVGEHEHVGPTLILIRPPGVGADEAPERIQRVPALRDRIDQVLLGAAPLHPPSVLHRDLAGLDLHRDDPRAGHRDKDVDFVFLLVRGDALAHDDETVLGQLISQELDDRLLGRMTVDGVSGKDSSHTTGIPQPCPVAPWRRELLSYVGWP